MSGFSWTLPALPDAGSAPPLSDTARVLGRDIWLDLSSVRRIVPANPSGDMLVAEGEEALRQSILRELVTEPGEFPTKPEYGIGLVSYVRQKLTDSRVAALKTRIAGRVMRDARVAAVEVVTVRPDANVVHVSVRVKTKSGSTVTAAIGVGI